MWLPETGGRVLDLGAGEGYVGEAAAHLTGAAVSLADVLPLNRTALPFTRLVGERLPFSDEHFDTTLLIFVLHHAENPRRLLSEAVRVSRDSVILAESVHGGPFHHRLLTRLDKAANRLRSGGAMSAQESHLHFRTEEGWKRLIGELGLTVTASRRRGRLIHRQVYLRVEKRPR
jgi:SAM-dependent methyltransferase